MLRGSGAAVGFSPSSASRPRMYSGGGGAQMHNHRECAQERERNGEEEREKTERENREFEKEKMSAYLRRLNSGHRRGGEAGEKRESEGDLDRTRGKPVLPLVGTVEGSLSSPHGPLRPPPSRAVRSGPPAAGQRATAPCPAAVEAEEGWRTTPFLPFPWFIWGSYGVGKEEPSSGAPTPFSSEDGAPLWGPPPTAAAAAAAVRPPPLP
ncbi:hypothetical protein Sjap_001320 [Stephania japonica]|uniref:Uncharacterized protein n=1 Tax=Stephania japonica TaxID=461633 RepID=A0AAP0KM96_9MAGN